MAFRVLASAVFTVSGSSARIPIPYPQIADKGGQGNVVRLGNAVRLQPDGCDQYIKIGGASVVAAAPPAGFMMQDNAIEEFNVNPDLDTHVAALQVATGGTLKVDVGTTDSK